MGLVARVLLRVVPPEGEKQDQGGEDGHDRPSNGEPTAAIAGDADPAVRGLCTSWTALRRRDILALSRHRLGYDPRDAPWTSGADQPSRRASILAARALDFSLARAKRKPSDGTGRATTNAWYANSCLRKRIAARLICSDMRPAGPGARAGTEPEFRVRRRLRTLPRRAADATSRT